MNRGISSADASVSLEPFPVEPEQLAEVVSACARDSECRRAIGKQESLAWLGEDPERRQPVGTRATLSQASGR